MFGLKKLAASAAIAVASLGLASGAGATTWVNYYSGSGYTGSLVSTTDNSGSSPFTSTASFNVWDGASFGSDFFQSAGQGVLTFLLENNTDQVANLVLVATTVLQDGAVFGSYVGGSGLSAGLTSGVRVVLDPLGDNIVRNVASGDLFSEKLGFDLGAQSSALLYFFYGDPTADADTLRADIDFTLRVVPLPAGGLLLLSALGGLGLVRRRREKVALA